MQLTVREVARLLNVTEKTVYRWLREGTIPAMKIHDQYRFNRAELLEWASARKMTLAPEFFQENAEGGGAEVLPSLSAALKTGGIYYRLEGNDVPSVLRAIVSTLKLPEEVDREALLQVLLAREELASTGIGDGIAIPHARNPIVLNVPYSMIALSFLKQPIDFKALDRKPVNCFFTLVSPTARTHLHLLSKLAFALRDPAFKKIILRPGTAEEIFKEAERIEINLAKSAELTQKKRKEKRV